jgi:hypothetical protein
VAHDRRIALGAKLAVVRRIGRITLDLVDDAIVSNVHDGAAGVQAHLAGTADPLAVFQGILDMACSCSHCDHSWRDMIRKYNLKLKMHKKSIQHNN